MRSSFGVAATIFIWWIVTALDASWHWQHKRFPDVAKWVQHLENSSSRKTTLPGDLVMSGARQTFCWLHNWVKCSCMCISLQLWLRAMYCVGCLCGRKDLCELLFRITFLKALQFLSPHSSQITGFYRVAGRLTHSRVYTQWTRLTYWNAVLPRINSFLESFLILRIKDTRGVDIFSGCDIEQTYYTIYYSTSYFNSQLEVKLENKPPTEWPARTGNELWL